MPPEHMPSGEPGAGGTPGQPPERPPGAVPGAAGWVPPQPPPPLPQQPPPAGLTFGAWPQPAPPPPTAGRSRARAVVTGSVVALAAALIAGAVGYEIGVQHSRISSAVQGIKAVAAGACPAGETTPDPSATSPAGAALLARLLPVPHGATSAGPLAQGVLSLRGYLNALYPGNAIEQQRLTTRCFQTAVHRGWQAPGGTIISEWLTQFGTAADARSYTLETEQADAADPANTDKFTIAGVGDGMGLARPALDKYGNTFTRVLGDAGNVSMIIHIYIPARTNNTAAARVLQDQNDRLSAGPS